MRKQTFILLLICLSCVHYTKYIPDPEKDIEKWVANFARQRSFSYRNSLQTQVVYTQTQGDCVIGRIEHNKGKWYAAGQAIDFEYYGLGDMQYSRSAGKWELTTRGEESDVLIQVTRVLEFDKFEYVGFEDGYLYNFKANIPFLAPGRWKEITGRLMISARNYLPEKIWTGLPDSSVYWKIELSDYNKKKNLKPPLQKWQSYVLSSDFDFTKAMKQRMELLEIDYKLDKTKDDIILTVPKQYNIDDIKELLQNRCLIAYGVVAEKGTARRVAYLGGEKKNPIYLGDILFDQKNIKKAKIKFDGASTPYIELSLNDKIVPEERIALEVDSIVVSVVSLDTKKKIDKINLYIEMSYYEMQVLMGGLLEHLPQVEVREVTEK
jgi:hypothetical protein